jgi:predicted nicotinamide N-methyase
MACSKLGARRVWLSDQPDMLDHLQRNVEKNGCERVEVAELSWEDAVLPSYLAKVLDVVVVCDCAYNHHVIKQLLHILRSLLNVLVPGGVVWIAQELRSSEDHVLLLEGLLDMFEVNRLATTESSVVVYKCTKLHE